MFDIGATELLLIGIVAIIVVGPKELPKMLRAFGQFVGKMRGMAREFQSMFEEAARDTGVDDLAKGVSDVKNFSVTDTLSETFDPVKDEFDEMKLDLDPAEAPKSPATADTKPKPDPIEEGNRAAAEMAAKNRDEPAKPAASKKKAPKKTAAAKKKEPAAKTAG